MPKRHHSHRSRCGAPPPPPRPLPGPPCPSPSRPPRRWAPPPAVPPSAWRQGPRAEGGQLEHHLRLSNTESRHDGSDVTNLLRSVPQNPLLRPRLSESLGPPTTGLFFEQLEEHRLGRRSLPDRGRVVQLALLLPGPGLLLSS